MYVYLCVYLTQGTLILVDEFIKFAAVKGAGTGRYAKGSSKQRIKDAAGQMGELSLSFEESQGDFKFGQLS